MSQLYNAIFNQPQLSVEPKDLTGKVILITGGNEGIGFNTAIQLAKMKGTIIIASRNESKSIKAVEEIKKISGNTNIHYELLNLSSFKSIDQFADQFTSKYPQLDILINNAGCTFWEHQLTDDQLERSVQVNHFGPLRLTLCLLPILKKTENSRIIFVASEFHNYATLTLPQDLHPSSEGFDPMNLYCQAKLMNILSANELADKLKDTSIKVCSLHPGFVATNIPFTNCPYTWDGIVFTAKTKVNQWLYARNGEQGSMTSVYAATSDEIATGQYYDSCKLGELSELAKDKQLSSQLWTESLNLLGMDTESIFN